MHVNRIKRQLPRKFLSEHHHPRHPEEENVVPSLEAGAASVGVETLVVRLWACIGGPPHDAEGPKTAREPRVEHIRVLRKLHVVTVLLLGLDICLLLRSSNHILCGGGEVSRPVNMPDGDAVPPPQLPRDTPVMDVVEPVEPSFLKSLGDDLEFAALDSLYALVGHTASLDKPLGAHKRFNHLPSTLRPGDALHVRLGLNGNTHLLKVAPKLFARFKAIHALVLSAVFIECGIAVHDVDGLKICSLSNLVVVGIVPWRNLEAPRAKLHIDIVICDDWYLSVLRRHKNALAHKVLVPLVFGVDTDCCIAEDSLGARGGDRKKVIRPTALDGIFEVVELALFLRVLNLKVRHRGLEVWAPVDHVLATVHQTLVMELNKGSSSGLRETFIHREALTRPVSRRA
mmetsp:Transcript_5897/g.11421  ORF Transcript_5897/g.11421 Transcript_5897/m.11421 type:complete len:400 (-) Transcript_5897:471-1670(-)